MKIITKLREYWTSNAQLHGLLSGVVNLPRAGARETRILDADMLQVLVEIMEDNASYTLRQINEGFYIFNCTALGGKLISEDEPLERNTKKRLR